MSLLPLLLLLAGLPLLIGGGEGLVRGASGLARGLGVSPLAIGLTVVAFGTSAPELAVNVLAALRGDTTLSFGNVVGSNIANVGLVLGCAAVLRPLEVHSTVVGREIPMMLLASAAVLALALDPTAAYDRVDGIALLLFFCVFLYYTVMEVLRGRTSDPLVEEAAAAEPVPKARSTSAYAVAAAAGLAALIAGAELTVRGAVSLAEALGVPKDVIGLTLVAVGTSLPELVTSIVATLRGQLDLAVGNVVGSNIFNALFILGTTAVIRPVSVPEVGVFDVIVMTALAAALFVFAWTNSRRVVRWEGCVLLTGYVGYIVIRVNG